MALSLAIESIVSKISTQFGAEDAAVNESYKQTIRAICAGELEPIFQAPAQPVVAPLVQYAAVPAKRGRNGYNLFSSELRQKLTTELGSEALAKTKFKELGGVTVYCAEEWKKLTQPQKDVYNARAKAERMAAVAVGGPVAVPVLAVAKRAPSLWQRFQKAYGADLKAKKAAGDKVPTFANIGLRTKACSAAYKPLKAEPAALLAYLVQYGA